MTRCIAAHFDGQYIVPDEPVQLPVGQHLLIHVELTEPVAPPAAGPGNQALADLLDYDFLQHCETLADDSVTIEQVRTALSKIPGSMAAAIIEDRNDRV